MRQVGGSPPCPLQIAFTRVRRVVDRPDERFDFRRMIDGEAIVKAADEAGIAIVGRTIEQGGQVGWAGWAG